MRQCGRSYADAILYVEGCDINVSSNLEVGGHGHLSVAGGISLQVGHTRRAVNLHLYRCCDGLLNRYGIGANVGTGYLHRRRRDFGVLTNWEAIDRQYPHHYNYN